MGWELRNGSPYYYRKKRVNGRVVSEYLGTGLIAEIHANDDAAAHCEREQARQLERQLRHAEQLTEQQLDTAEQAIEPITAAYLIAAGFHKHRGQWRKKRHASQ